MLGRLIAVVCVLGAACSFDPRGSAPSDGGVERDAGAVDAARADGAPCVPGCEGATLVECDGNTETRTPCPVDCTEAGGPHCGELVASNGVEPDLLAGADGELRARDGEIIRIEADTGRILRDGVELRAAGEGLVSGIRYVAGPPYNVFAFDALRVDRDGTVLIRATNATSGITSPIILYLSGEARISGLVDITAGCPDGSHWCAGVGGGNGGTNAFLPSGCAPGAEGSSDTLADATGGGGGGFGQNGAAGGDSIDFSGGAGGDGSMCTGETLVPLEGGSGGDRGGSGGRGGGGGGAIQITSLDRITIEPGGGVPAGIWAGAGGGEGGGVFNGGGGGGSGGAILLEAPVVDIAAGAILAANGGGGGEGDGSGNGQDGLLADMPAGGGGGTVVRHGGKGGCCTTPPEVGDGPGSGTGGGGGGAGRIRLNARDLTTAGTVTPPASTGPLSVQ